MDDMERYGDYNEIDESPKGSPAFTILKILVSAICLLVAGVSVGRLREDSIYDFKFVGLSHNTLRGAAGGAVLIAELLFREGYLVKLI